jgi:hypothetical protein
MRVGFLVITALVLAGCYPARTQKASSWTGTVFSDRRPVVGAKVTLVRRDGVEEATHTDSLGQFHFAGERGWTLRSLIRFTYVDCDEHWSVEVEREAGSSRGIAVSGLGPCIPPEFIRMTCDFARETAFCEVLEPTRLNRGLKELANKKANAA